MNESVKSYVRDAVPQLFSETEKLVKRFSVLVSRWGFLNCDDIRDVGTVFEEEYADAAMLVCMAESGNLDAQPQFLQVLQSAVEDRVISAKKAVASVLEETSEGGSFFIHTLSFLEKLDSPTHANEERTDEELRAAVIGRLNQDYEESMTIFEHIENLAYGAVIPLENKIVEKLKFDPYFECGRVYNQPPFEIADLVIRRACCAEGYRIISRNAQAAFDREFDKVKRWLAPYGIRISKM